MGRVCVRLSQCQIYNVPMVTHSWAFGTLHKIHWFLFSIFFIFTNLLFLILNAYDLLYNAPSLSLNCFGVFATNYLVPEMDDTWPYRPGAQKFYSGEKPQKVWWSEYVRLRTKVNISCCCRVTSCTGSRGSQNRGPKHAFIQVKSHKDKSCSISLPGGYLWWW